ncbi:MAG: hypothetical protein ACE5I1_21680 [bacterium]
MQRSNSINNSIVAVLLLGFIAVIGCDDNNPFSSDRNFVAKKTFSYEVQVANHARLNLAGVAGTISITGVSGSNTVKITSEKRVESHSQSDAELASWDVQRWARNGFAERG